MRLLQIVLLLTFLFVSSGQQNPYIWDGNIGIESLDPGIYVGLAGIQVSKEVVPVYTHIGNV